LYLKVKPVRKKNGSIFPKTWNSVLRERGVTGSVTGSSSRLDETDWSFSRVTRTDAVLGAGAATAGPGQLADVALSAGAATAGLGQLAALGIGAATSGLGQLAALGIGAATAGPGELAATAIGAGAATAGPGELAPESDVQPWLVTVHSGASPDASAEFPPKLGVARIDAPGVYVYSWHKPFFPGYTGQSTTTTSKVAVDPAKRSSDMRVGTIESCTRKYMFVDGTMRIVLVVLRAIYGSQVAHNPCLEPRGLRQRWMGSFFKWKRFFLD
jgi:hypothetical protein